MESQSLSDTFKDIKQAVLPEFTGSQPVMRIDFFAVFELCMRLLEDLVQTLESEPEVLVYNMCSSARFDVVDSILDLFAAHAEGNYSDPLLTREHLHGVVLVRGVFERLKKRELSDVLRKV